MVGVSFTFTVAGETNDGAIADLSAALLVWEVVSGVGTIDSDTGVFESSRADSAEVSVTVVLNDVELSDTLSISVVSAAPGDVDFNDKVDAVDVQLVINEALGIDNQHDCDINGDEMINAVDVQLVINAALGIDISGSL